MISWLKLGLHFGLQFRFWVAICVGSLALFCEQTLAPTIAVDGGPTTTPRVVAAATLALYNLDGTLDCPPEETERQRRRRAHWWLTLGSGLWLLTELLTWGSVWAGVIFICFCFCATYAVRLVVGGHTLQIKSVPGLKAPFVGGAVGSAAVAVPLLVRASSDVAPRPDSMAVLLACALACFCSANALLFDLPDHREDLQMGVPTTATRHGVQSTRLQSRAWILAGAIISVGVAPPARLPLWTLAAALLLATWLVDMKSRKSTLALWVDGALSLPLIVLNLSH